MVYSVPESKRSVDQNQFEFTVPAKPDQVFRVPKVKYLPLGSMEVLQGSTGNVTLGDILDLFARVDEASVAAAELVLENTKSSVKAKQEARRLLASVVDERAVRDAVRTLDSDQLAHLTNAWQKDSGVELGESSGSSTS